MRIFFVGLKHFIKKMFSINSLLIMEVQLAIQATVGYRHSTEIRRNK